MPDRRVREEGPDAFVPCCRRREPSVPLRGFCPPPHWVEQADEMSHFGCRWFQGKLYPSAHSLAAAKYQARRQGSAVGLCVAHLDEGSVNCPIENLEGSHP